MHHNIILSEAGTPSQLEVRILIGFLQFQHLNLPIGLKVPGKEEEPLASRVIEHELDVVLVVHGEELSDYASFP